MGLIATMLFMNGIVRPSVFLLPQEIYKGASLALGVGAPLRAEVSTLFIVFALRIGRARA